MELNDIKKLLKLVEKSSISELEIRQDASYVRIARQPDQHVSLSSPVPGQDRQAQDPAALVPAAGLPPERPEPDDTLVEICSPMVGTFYTGPSPDAEPYVHAGDTVKPGNVLCIIEAMKLMNEIESEISGKIVTVLAENGQPVEYNQPLFLAEKR